MNQIKITSNHAHGYTIISNLFIDKYMPSANGDFVKIYLHLLRYADDNSSQVSLSSVADIFNITESDVLRAIKYWSSLNLISASFEKEVLVSIHLLPIQVSLHNDETAAAAAPSEKLPERSYSRFELEQILSNEDMHELLMITEKYIGKPLTFPDMQFIAYICDELQFSRDLIEYLIEYCVEKGQKSFHYIKAVALAWSEQGIDSVSKAKEQTNTFSKKYFMILKAFGISGRNPTHSEIEFMKKWLNNYAFDISLILFACERTISATHQPSFEYTDSILSKWHKENVKTKQDIQVLDELFQKEKSKRAHADNPASPAQTKPQTNKFHNFEQRDYDFDKLESHMIRVTHS